MERKKKNACNEDANCPVSSWNEWDPLEEVIVGTAEGAMSPAWNLIEKATVPPGTWPQVEKQFGGAGNPYSKEYIEIASNDLEEFCNILKSEGVIVRRPNGHCFDKGYGTPSWSVDCGYCAANPRDVFLVVGNEIIEAPMADRSRYFEAWPYRHILKEYFNAGAKWVAAPKPQLKDQLYESINEESQSGKDFRFVTNETEPIFDAADFVRCDRDIFGQRSHVTNEAGITWLKRYLGKDFCIHIIKNKYPQVMHIDTTMLPLGPRKVLVNPDHFDLKNMPEVLKDYKIYVAPQPEPIKDERYNFTLSSTWLGMNIFSLDEKRVFVDKSQPKMVSALKEWGFEPIPCSFSTLSFFGAGFHCVTLDIRRRARG